MLQPLNQVSWIRALGIKKVPTGRPKASFGTSTSWVGLFGFLEIKSGEPVGFTEKKNKRRYLKQRKMFCFLMSCITSSHIVFGPKPHWHCTRSLNNEITLFLLEVFCLFHLSLSLIYYFGFSSIVRTKTSINLIFGNVFFYPVGSVAYLPVRISWFCFCLLKVVVIIVYIYTIMSLFPIPG